MKTYLIISFFAALCAVFVFSSVFSEANAQKKDTMQPATHLWLQNFENLLFVPVRSVEQCEKLVRQASNLNSSEGLCYLNDELVKRVECTKPLKKGATPSCK